MTVPSYTTDLTTLAIGSITVDAGTWDESSNSAWDDAGSMVDDGNLYYNGSKCVSAQYTKDGVGTIMYEHTSTFTVPTDGAILIHHLWAAPPALATLAGGGIIVLVGNAFGTFYGWNASGSDAPPAPRGGWVNYAINPAIASPDHTVGSPGSPWDTVGVAVTATQQARGNPNAVNAIRYGRCESIFEYGESADYATFDGFALEDAIITNKWNLLDKVKKGTYELQGLMSLGTSSNAVDMRDSNVNILIADTINVTSGFTKIEVNHADSNIEWTAISLAALGITTKGSFEAIDNATISKVACTFTDNDFFIYQSNSTIEGNTTFRRCGLVTQGGATFTSVIFDKASGTVALSVDDLSLVSKSTFNSDGTGHAVDLGTFAATDSVTWDNTDNDYAATDGSTGNETILVNVPSGVTLTINRSASSSTPTVMNSAGSPGTINIVQAVTLTIVAQISLVGAEVRIYDLDNSPAGSLGTELSGVESHSSATYIYSGSGGNSIWIQIMLSGYEEFGQQLTMPSVDGSFTALLEADLNA